jgi:3-isopropylmalate/(R)-2-methylmalate dehydratase large subunit
MAIEGGARVGYVNPDQATFDYLRGRPQAPAGAKWDKALAYWKSVVSDKDAVYDDTVNFDAADIEPIVTWGITPDQSVGVNGKLPEVSRFSADEAKTVELAYKHMDFKPGSPIKGTPIDVAFIGSCTNGRISDLREAAKVAKGRKVAKTVRAFVVPGSQKVKLEAEKEGLDRVFKETGFEWREAGCSMCLAMNPDKLKGREISASSSNRNFIGRQGSKDGRTMLMSPAMVAAAAIEGKIADVREVLK